ncbi:MAG: hypothetical protein GWN85_31075, partial [Gemmatimonadetes bacterium]|nr:hypothetical protein [Gemmatimonadota bacterium]NIR39772.1 hypothetical protein [Actinomycetota bacterium]NIS34531.1 hypothetical protein [Actinomycetota bacterium]NIU69293.1 hypothetical protein [Actinomycetota bacterium]NIW31166.1 hypothetical protein [Actinomycetota bacterium]
MQHGYARAIAVLVAVVLAGCVGRESTSQPTLRGVWDGSNSRGQEMTFAFDGNGHALWTMGGQRG